MENKIYTLDEVEALCFASAEMNIYTWNKTKEHPIPGEIVSETPKAFKISDFGWVPKSVCACHSIKNSTDKLFWIKTWFLKKR